VRPSGVASQSLAVSWIIGGRIATIYANPVEIRATYSGNFLYETV
jgi:hypothetical protein